MFFLLLCFFVLGYVKFNGWVHDYFKYLNEKNRKESISKVDLWKPSSYVNVFWEDGVDELWIINNEWLTWDLNIEELEIDGLSGIDDDIDVFDPEFQDDFDDFFASEDDTVNKNQIDEETGNVIDEKKSFGFVDNVDSESWIENNEELSWWNITWFINLSDNKKSLLEKAWVNK